MASNNCLEACNRLNWTDPQFRKGTVAQIDAKIRDLNRFMASGSIERSTWNVNFKNIGEQIGTLPRTPDVCELERFYLASYGPARPYDFKLSYLKE